MPSKKSQKTRRTTRSGAQGTKRPTSSATPNPKRPRRTASTQVEEDQSQPRPLSTDGIPTIVNAVLQARQIQPPVTGDNGNPGNDILRFVETTTRLLVVSQTIQSQILPMDYRHPHARPSPKLATRTLRTSVSLLSARFVRVCLFRLGLV